MFLYFMEIPGEVWKDEIFIIVSSGLHERIILLPSDRVINNCHKQIF